MKKRIHLSLIMAVIIVAVLFVAPLQAIGFLYHENTPNPFSPDSGPIQIKYVIDSQTAASVKTTIKIYNMAGKLIRAKVDGELRQVGILCTDSWNGKDNRGRECLNGRYILQIVVEDNLGKKKIIDSIALVK